MERVYGFARRRVGVECPAPMALLSKAENDAGADDLVVGMGRDAGVESKGGGLERGFIRLDVFQEF